MIAAINYKSRKTNTAMNTPVHQLRISLRDVKPAVWREVLVPSGLRLDRLHQVIQVAMGWEDDHMHEFILGSLRDGEHFGVKAAHDPFGFGVPPVSDETRFTLGKLLPRKGNKLIYWYDFGDDWYHDIVVKKVDVADVGLVLPWCLAGNNACPPEDSGGPWGYAELLDVLGNPEHPDHAEMRDWTGDSFDPGLFDLDATNAQLARISAGWKRKKAVRVALP